MEALGFEPLAEASLAALTSDVGESSAIEGEKLDPDQVRSSISRRLGLDVGGGRGWTVEAPGTVGLEAEMSRFIKWLNAPAVVDPVLRAGIAHLWFVTIHPFEDGNGRIARAIAD